MNHDDGPGSSSSRVFDSGLQLERTALAWRRTSASLLVVFLLAARSLTGVPAAWLVGIACIGSSLSFGASLLARIRYQRMHRLLTSMAEEPVATVDGRVIAATAALVGALGLAGLLALTIPLRVLA